MAKWADRRRGNRHQQGYGTAWDKVRLLALQRDCYLCQSCRRKGRTVEAQEVHHLTEKAKGGSDDLANLESICRECHQVATIKARGHRVRYGGTVTGESLDPDHHWNK